MHNNNISDLRPTYIVDQTGTRTNVILSIAEFELLWNLAQGIQNKTEPSGLLHEYRPTHIPELDPGTAEEVFSYTMPRKGAEAKAVWRYPTMRVLKGSLVANEETATMPEAYRLLRRWLIDKKVIDRFGDQLRFTCDYSFNNASEAVCVVEGGSRSGYESWRDTNGRTLAELGYRR